MTLPVEKMKLSDKELNCMKMCQKAPKCADFSINPGEACPRRPYPRLAFMHSVNQNTHINSQTRCYDPEYRLELFSVCESVPSSYRPPPHALAWLRVFCARMKIFHVLNIAPPTPHNMESWMRPCGSIATVSNIWDPDQARRFVWSDLGPTC